MRSTRPYELLWERELYRFVSDHREGQRPILAAPWRMSAAPTQIARGAPDLGEHNDYVLNEILLPHETERT
jgi:crotonobetainyl-CoA:carnitine CoA-transferase CaiB-like acyl-CoA transferase